jgi:antitoxin (DNA-binding transcriptional repressor) of toxin-antitoxin stability system
MFPTAGQVAHHFAPQQGPIDRPTPGLFGRHTGTMNRTRPLAVWFVLASTLGGQADRCVATLVVTTEESAVRSIGVREFRDQATSVMAAGETLVIERHGEPIGFFVPIVATDRRAGREALGRLGELVEDVMARSGMSEDDLVREVSGRRRRR